jgi:glycogen debranching enzyme
MDNVPRLKPGYHVSYSNGKMIWIDACLQAALSCDILIRMNEVLEGEDDVSDLVEEKARLEQLINTKLWDEETQFYYDLWDDDTLNGVKHLGGYWSLISHAIPHERVAGLVSHLTNENEFNRPTPVPTLSYDHPLYCPEGDYWRGSAWAPTNYMVLKGLERNGYDALAHDIAKNCLENVLAVFREDGTLYENYAPEAAAPGNPAKKDFVGWSGLFPISILFEYVFGIRPQARERRIRWDLRLLEKHGIMNYPLGDLTVDLICEKRQNRDDEPIVTVRCDQPVEVELCYGNKTKIIRAFGQN